jgi:hypothetical protein
MPNRSELLTELGRVTQKFKKWLDQDPKIDIMDQIYIDNHLEMLQFSYGTWKSKHTKSK